MIKAGGFTEADREKFMDNMQSPEYAKGFVDRMIKAGGFTEADREGFMSKMYPAPKGVPYADAPAQSSMTDQFGVFDKAAEADAENRRKAEQHIEWLKRTQEAAAKPRLMTPEEVNEMAAKPLLPNKEIDLFGRKEKAARQAQDMFRKKDESTDRQSIAKDMEELDVLKKRLEEVEKDLKGENKAGTQYNEELRSTLTENIKRLTEDTRKRQSDYFDSKISELNDLYGAAHVKRGFNLINPTEERKTYLESLAADMSDDVAADIVKNSALVRDALKNLQRAKRKASLDNDASAWSKFVSGVIDGIDGGAALTFGISDISEAFHAKEANQRMKDGKGTEADRILVESLLDKMEAEELYEPGKAGQIGQGVYDSLEFMLDMAITGGIGGAAIKGVKAAGKAIAKTAGREIAKEAAETAAKSATKQFAKQIGKDLAASAAGSVVSPMVYNETLRRQNENYMFGRDENGEVYVKETADPESLAASFAQSLLSNNISRVVERGVGPVLEKGVQALARPLAKITHGWLKFGNNFLSNLGKNVKNWMSLQGMFSETGEEFVEEILTRALVGQTAREKELGAGKWEDMFSPEWCWVTVGSVAVIQAAMGLPGFSASTANAAGNSARMRKHMRNLPDHLREEVRRIARMEDDNQRAQALSEVLKRSTDLQRRDILGYMTARAANNLGLSFRRAEAQQQETEAYRQTLMTAAVGNELWITTDRNGNRFAYKFNPNSYDVACVAYPIEGEAEDGTLQIGKPRQMSMDNLDIRNAQKYPVETLLQALSKRQEAQDEAQDTAIEQQEQQAARPDADAQKTYVAGHEFNYTDPKGNLKTVARGSRIVPTETVQSGADPNTQVHVAITKPGGSTSMPGVMALSEFQDMVERGYIAAEEQTGADTAGDVQTDEEGNPVVAEDALPQEGEPVEPQQESDFPDGGKMVAVEGEEAEEPQQEAETAIKESTESNGLIGRSATEEEAAGLIAQMEAGAEVAPEVELNPTSWAETFDDDNSIETPIGRVKMGEHQISKFFSKGRTKEFGMVAPTLRNPDLIIEKESNEPGAERSSKYLFVKTFVKPDGSRYVHFESVTVRKDGMEISVSSHEADGNVIKKEMQNGKILHLNKALPFSSEGYLTETPNKPEGSDLVPTPGNLEDKGTEVSEEKQVRLPENPVQTQYEALLSDNEGDEAEAVDTAQQMVANKTAELEQAQKSQPKGKTVEAIQAAKRAKREKVAALENEVRFWKDVAAYPEARRQAEEAARKLQERINRQQAAEKGAKTRTQPAFMAKDDIKGDPKSLREYLLRRIASGTVKFTKEGAENLKSLSSQDISSSYINDKTGVLPESYSEDVRIDLEQNGWPFGVLSAEDIREELSSIDYSKTPTDMMQEARDLHENLSYDEERRREEYADEIAEYEEQQKAEKRKKKEAEREERAREEAAEDIAQTNVAYLSDEEYEALSHPEFVGEMFDEDGTPKRFSRRAQVQEVEKQPSESERAVAVAENAEEMSFEALSEAVGDVEAEWNEKIMDYIYEHYPTQATVSAATNSEQGLREREAMNKDERLKQLRAEMKAAVDKAEAAADEAWRRENKEWLREHGLPAKEVDAVDEAEGNEEVRMRRGEPRQYSDLSAEERGLVERAKADGTYLKAPNGKPTKLTPKQWAQVHTKAFKDWFGDWEKAARIKKLRESKPIVATGTEYQGKYELNDKSARAYILNSLRDEYPNNDTGINIKLSRLGAEKVTSHDADNDIHLKSIALIPQMLREAIFIAETKNEKDKRGFDKYRYYVVGLKIDRQDYTAKLAIGVKGNETYYDHALTEIEKTNLIDNIGPVKTGLDDNEAVSAVKDKRLLSILQTDTSKVVDENGEPLVVYHGSPNRFFAFDTKKIGSSTGTSDGRGFYFTTDRTYADSYSNAEGQTLGVFLNIRNPLSLDRKTITKKQLMDIIRRIDEEEFSADGEHWFISNYGDYNSNSIHNIIREAADSEYEYADNDVELINSMVGGSGNFDLVMRAVAEVTGKSSEIVPKENGTVHYIVTNSMDIKSATDNVGTFEAENPDIRFRFVGEMFDAEGRPIRARFIGEKGAANLDKAEEATTRLDNLSVAREMEAAGKEAKTIKMATGWERGADGKWRYETGDDVAGVEVYSLDRLEYEYKEAYRAYKRAYYAVDAFYNKYHDVMYSRMSSNNSPEKNAEIKARREAAQKEYHRLFNEMKEARKKKIDKKKLYRDGVKKKLSEVLGEENPLFSAYPEMKDLNILLHPTNSETFGYAGYYDHYRKTLFVDNSMKSTMRSVLTHEIQHAIQFIEGFAHGGGLHSFEAQKKYKEKQTHLIESKINELERQLPKPNEEWTEEHDKIEEEINALEERKFNLSNINNDYLAYIHVSGEVESRNVQARMDMKPGQRRASLSSETEDVAREEQIFLNDALGTSAASEEKPVPSPSSVSGKAKRQAAEALARRLGVPVVIEDRGTPKGRSRRFADVKGWFVLPNAKNPNGVIHVNVDNHADVEDVERTMLHEVVAHMGMRKMLGEEKYNNLLDKVYGSMNGEARAYFEEYARQEVGRREGMTDEEYRAELQRVAADEYIAALAEVGTDPTTWQKVVALVREALRAIGFNLSLSDADIRALLYESRHNLESAAYAAERELFRQRQEEFRAAAELENRIREDEREYKQKAPKVKTKGALSNKAGLRTNHQDPVTSFESTTKIRENIDTLIRDCEENKVRPRNFAGVISSALALHNNGNNSNYGTFEAKNGTEVRIRISDHNAKAKNFDDAGYSKGISIVISRKPNQGIGDGDAHIVEYYYNAYKLAKADGHPLAEIARSVKQLLYSGEFKDNTGLAERQEINEDIRSRRGFDNGIDANGLYGLLDEVSDYYGGAAQLISDLERYYGGEIVSASAGARAAIEQDGLVPFADGQYSGKDNEYHHIAFMKDGERVVEAVPFTSPESLRESRPDIRFRRNLSGTEYDKRLGIVGLTPEGATKRQQMHNLSTLWGKRLLDSSLPVKNLTNHLKQTKGGKVTSATDLWSLKTTIPSKVMHGIDRFKKTIGNPLSDTIRDIYRATREQQKGLGIPAKKRSGTYYIGMYLMAKHMPERNAWMLADRMLGKTIEDIAQRIFNMTGGRGAMSDKDMNELRRSVLTKAGGNYNDALSEASIQDITRQIHSLIEKRNQERLDKEIARAEKKGIEAPVNSMRPLTAEDMSRVAEKAYAALNDRMEKLTDEDKDFAGATAFVERFGMQPEEYVAMFEDMMRKNGLEDKLDKMWDLINQATHETLRERLESGLLSQEAYDNIMARGWKNYVPLRSWDERNEESADYYEIEYPERIDNNSTVFTNPTIKAEGRHSLADNPLPYIFRDAETAIRKSEENRFFQAVAKLRDDNANFTYIFGNAEFLEGKETSKEKNSHLVPYYNNGVKTNVVFVNPQLAAAVRGDTESAFGKVWRSAALNWIPPVTRYMSAMLTSLNPAFATLNLMRDLGLATLSRFVEAPDPFRGTWDAALFLYEWFRNMPAAIQASARPGSIYTGEGRNARLIRAWKENGGETGWHTLNDLRRTKDQLYKEITKSGARKNLENVAASIPALFRFFTEVSENSVRLAAFSDAKRRGLDDQAAAFYSKEITTNFNRHSNLSSAINPLYMFFNAATQGINRILQLMKENPGNFVVAAVGMFMAGFVSAITNAAGGDDDDDYLHRSFYVRANNLVVGKWTIPLAHGFRMFYGLGAAYADYIMGNASDAEMFYNMLGLFGNELLPGPLNVTDLAEYNSVEDRINWLGKEGIGDYMRNIWPSSVLPLYDIYRNRDFMGGAISQEPFAGTKSEYTPRVARSKKNVNPYLEALNQKWAGLFGFDPELDSEIAWDDEKGRPTSYPAVSASDIEYIIGQYAGGTGEFVNDIVKLGTKIGKGEDFSKADVPVLKKLYRPTDQENAILSDYYTIKEYADVLQAKLDESWKQAKTEINLSAKGRRKAVNRIRTLSVLQAESQLRAFGSYEEKVAELYKLQRKGVSEDVLKPKRIWLMKEANSLKEGMLQVLEPEQGERYARIMKIQDNDLRGLAAFWKFMEDTYGGKAANE